MHVIVFSVELDQLGIELFADTIENVLERGQPLFVERLATALDHEHQMHLKTKHGMPCVVV